jgi:hypothetical protein
VQCHYVAHHSRWQRVDIGEALLKGYGAAEPRVFSRLSGSLANTNHTCVPAILRCVCAGSVNLARTLHSQHHADGVVRPRFTESATFGCERPPFPSTCFCIVASVSFLGCCRWNTTFWNHLKLTEPDNKNWSRRISDRVHGIPNARPLFNTYTSLINQCTTVRSFGCLVVCCYICLFLCFLPFPHFPRPRVLLSTSTKQMAKFCGRVKSCLEKRDVMFFRITSAWSRK